MVSKGDFTTDKHFIVIRDYKDGFFYVNDPTSTERSEVGWDFRRLRSQISKMCALEAGTTTSSDDDSSNGDNQGTGETGDDTTNTPAE